jgi:hypothetical protein
MNTCAKTRPLWSSPILILPILLSYLSEQTLKISGSVPLPYSLIQIVYFAHSTPPPVRLRSPIYVCPGEPIKIFLDSVVTKTPLLLERSCYNVVVYLIHVVMFGILIF